MKRPALYLSYFILLFLSACRSSVSPGQLYGKWKYIKLVNPNANPPHTTPDWELKIQSPTIEFTKSNDLIMIWGGDTLAHGKFRTDGDKIQFKQALSDGQTREFPFYVTELTDKQITFETRGGEDASVVTAVR